MQVSGFDILAPGLIEQPWSQAQALGCATWLWMHSESHRDAPLHTLPVLLMPPLLQRQFVIATQSDKPVFYMAWAMLSEEAEGRYLRNAPILMSQADWTSGDRMWVTDWIAPFGHTQAMTRLVLKHLLPHSCMRSLKHRAQGALRVNTFRGRQVAPDDAQRWWRSRPIHGTPEIDVHRR